MEAIEEEEGYSDDDLDALPSDDFHELQQDAIRSTQQPRSLKPIKSPYLNRGDNGNQKLGGLEQLTIDGIHDSLHHQPSSDYGDFDDEMLDGQIFDAAEQPTVLAADRRSLEAIDESMQREQWQQQRYNRRQKPSSVAARHDRAPRSRDLETSLPVSPLQNREAQSAAKPTSLTAPSEALQARIDEVCFVRFILAKRALTLAELLRLNERLQQEAECARKEALSKTGEISIIRANRAKEKQEEEKRLATERKVRNEEQARYHADIHHYKSELQKVSTEKAFTENDLARAAEQRKGVQRSNRILGKSRANGKENAAITPKKNNDLPFGDGFDDDEVQIVSPSKLAVRSKPATPKAGAKRKRKTTDNSPAKPLQLSQSKEGQVVQHPKEWPENRSLNNSPHALDKEITPQAPPLTIQQDERFKFTQKLLDHRINRNGERSFEALAEFALPSNTERKISSVLLDALSPLGSTNKTDNFAATIALSAITLWSQCLDALMYRAVALLMDLVRFILIVAPPGTAPYLTDELTALVQRTADVNLIPRIRRNHLQSLQLSSTPSNASRFYILWLMIVFRKRRT